MLFTTSKNKYDNLSLFYDNKKLKLVQSTKFLGVFIDDKLSWNIHVNYICHKIAKNIGVLSKLQFLPKDVLKMLYDTLILPYLSYCSIVWGYTSKSNLDKIHILQKRAVRIITCSDYLASSKPLFQTLKILPIYDMISLQNVLFMFKCHNDLLPPMFQNYFKQNCNFHSYGTRNSTNYHIPLFRTSISQHSIFYNGPVQWNDLPESLKSSKSYNYVKQNYKLLLLSM